VDKRVRGRTCVNIIIERILKYTIDIK
jgi:hypothetical protein